MKVIICGAGQVGFGIASYLAREGNDVTIIDHEADRIHHISESLDVRAIHGFASSPDILEQAGIRQAKMLIAVTSMDEVNMIACQIAHSLFDVPIKIARIRRQAYLDGQWANLFSRDHMPIDLVISPETEVANAIQRRLQVPGAFDTYNFAQNRVKLVGVTIDENCPVLKTPLQELPALFPKVNFRIILITRQDRPVPNLPEQQLLPGDHVYFLADKEHLTRVMAIFGHEEAEAHRIIIAGGGNIGLNLANRLEEKDRFAAIKIIEPDRERANHIAPMIKKGRVVCGSVLDDKVLREVNIQSAETFIAVTNNDDVNMLGSLLAKRHGATRCITLLNSVNYEPLVDSLGIDVVISPKSITIAKILQYVRKGRVRRVYPFKEGFGEVLEVEVHENLGLVGVPVHRLKLPKGVVIGALLRKDEVMIPEPATVINIGDVIILFVPHEAIHEVEKTMFFRVEFF